MREVLRGALPSALFFGVVVLLAVPATAQNSDPSGNTSCDDNGNCASNGNTVNAGNNGSGGTPGASNPTAPGSGSGYGDLGMGAGPDVPTNPCLTCHPNPHSSNDDTAQCTMYAASLTALQEYWDLGNCGTILGSLKKDCRDLAKQIDSLAAKVATCNS